MFVFSDLKLFVTVIVDEPVLLNVPTYLFVSNSFNTTSVLLSYNSTTEFSSPLPITFPLIFFVVPFTVPLLIIVSPA